MLHPKWQSFPGTVFRQQTRNNTFFAAIVYETISLQGLCWNDISQNLPSLQLSSRARGWKCPRLNPRGERLDARRQSPKCGAPRKGSSWNLPSFTWKNWNLGQFNLKQTKLGKQNHSEIWLLWYFGEDARTLFPISNAQFWVKNWKRHISLRFPEFLEHHHKQAQVYINHSKINRFFSVFDRVYNNFRLETVRIIG